MILTAGFIIFVAWSGLVLGVVATHGRRPSRVQRVAFSIAVAGVLLFMPAVLVGSLGIPNGWSSHWLGVAAAVGYVGLVVSVAGAGRWLVIDTVFVWSQRRRVFPFAFGERPGAGK